MKSFKASNKKSVSVFFQGHRPREDFSELIIKKCLISWLFVKSDVESCKFKNPKYAFFPVKKKREEERREGVKVKSVESTICYISPLFISDNARCPFKSHFQVKWSKFSQNLELRVDKKGRTGLWESSRVDLFSVLSRAQAQALLTPQNLILLLLLEKQQKHLELELEFKCSTVTMDVSFQLNVRRCSFSFY